ncbi:hypothetical protein KCV06_g557, partial [Aureobasidium melanogenum]
MRTRPDDLMAEMKMSLPMTSSFFWSSPVEFAEPARPERLISEARRMYSFLVFRLLLSEESGPVCDSLFEGIFTKHTVQRGQRHREEVLVGVAELKTTTVWAREQLPVYLYVCHCRGQPFGASENNSRGQNAARRVEVAVDEGQMDESTSERTCFFRRNAPPTKAPIRGIALFVTPAPVLDDAAVDVDVEVDLVMDVILDVADRVGVVMADVLVMPDTLAGPMLTVGSSVLDVVAGLILTLLWFINSVTPSLGPEQDLAAPWADAVRRGIVRLTRSFNHDVGRRTVSIIVHGGSTVDEDSWVVGPLELINLLTVVGGASAVIDAVAVIDEPDASGPVPDALSPVSQPSGRSRRLTRTRNHRVKGVYGECLPRWSRRLGHRYPVTKSAVCLWGYLTATHHAAVVCLRQEVVVCARLCHHGLHDNIVEACVTAPASHQYKGQGNVPIDSFGVSVLLFWAARDGRSFIGASRFGATGYSAMLLVLYAGLTLLEKARLSQKSGNWVAVGAFLPDAAATTKPLRGMTPCYVAGSTWRKVILYGWMKEQHFCCGFGDPQLCERQWREQVNMSLFLGSILNVLYAVLRLSQPRRRNDLANDRTAVQKVRMI